MVSLLKIEHCDVYEMTRLISIRSNNDLHEAFFHDFLSFECGLLTRQGHKRAWWFNGILDSLLNNLRDMSVNMIFGSLYSEQEEVSMVCTMFLNRELCKQTIQQFHAMINPIANASLGHHDAEQFQTALINRLFSDSIIDLDRIVFTRT